MNGSWNTSINNYNKVVWDKIFNEDILKSYSLLNAVENSKLPNVEHYYLDIKRGGDIVGILPCFTFSISLEILTTKAIKKIIHYIRNYFPNFLKIDIFVVGTPIAICDHLIGIISDTDKDKLEILENMLLEVRKKAKQLKCIVSIIKEIPEKNHLILKCLKDNNIIIGRSLPNSYVFLDNPLGRWPDAFKSRYKRRIKSQLKKAANNTNYKWKIVENYDIHSKRFENLYLQVLDKSEYKFEQLNANYFSAVAKELPNNSFALICTDNNNNIVCFELILVKDDTIIPLYVGVDYSHLKDGDLYFSCINNLILIAQEKGYKKIKLGQTSYLAKAYAGAIFEELKLGVFSQNKLLHIILKKFNRLLFTAPELPDVMVYRDEVVVALQLVAGKQYNCELPKESMKI